MPGITSAIKKIKPEWILVLTFVAVTWVNFNQELWKNRSVLTYDVAQYYSYLPALFYEHDLSQNFLKDTVNSSLEKKYYAPNTAPNGNHVFKMSMGMAMSYLPFFGLAHMYSAIMGIDPERGFSAAYHFAIQFSSLFYFLAGLFFLKKLLRFYFSDPVIALTLFCVTFGTNAFYYLTIGSGMSHATSFGLMSAFLYYTVKLHELPTKKHAFIVGCLGGILTLIRPINILIYIFFFLYKVTSFNDLKTKLKFFISNPGSILIPAVCGVLFFMPQLLYWNYISGHYFFNSYVDEHFYFFHPHILDGLFSFRKGWLLYTPLMCFALTGIYILRRSLKQFYYAILIFLVVYIYVVFSWWCWWYGGSFGQRPMIDVYPLLAVSLAVFFNAIRKQSIIKQITYPLISLLVVLNLFQSIQAKYNIIDFDSMTKKNYFRVFFTLTKESDRENYLQHPDYEKAKKGEPEY